MPAKWRRALESHAHPEYSPANHDHGDDYEALGAAAAAVAAHEQTPHGGNAAWADITGKPATFPPEAHAHDYAATDHNHAGVYATAAHNHDASYSALGHDHAGVYATVDHTHPGGSEAFPVGAVFIAVVSTNPATLLGYGTWAAFGAGRVLVGIDAGQTEFDTARETGGAKTVTLTAAQSGLPQHTHTQNAHNHTQNAHSHTYASQTATTGAVSSYEHGAIDTSSTAAESSISVNAATATNQEATAVNQNAGPTNAAEAHSNLQPYIVVYMWERTA